jgi:RNA polymerase sigma factor (sigma-70 family)
MKEYTDEEVLKGLGEGNHRVCNWVYERWYSMIEQMVRDLGGTREHARDVFQDALLVILRKVKSNDLSLSCRFSTYLYSVCRKIWSTYLKSAEAKTRRMASLPDMVCEPSPAAASDERLSAFFDKHFGKLSQACQKILRLHMNNASIAQITKIMKHASDHYTMDRKYRCKKSLLRSMGSDPEYREILSEHALVHTPENPG